MKAKNNTVNKPFGRMNARLRDGFRRTLGSLAAIAPYFQFIPGLIGVLFYLGAVRWTVSRKPDSGPAGERTGWGDRLKALKGVWAVVLLFFLVIGGLYGALNVYPINLTFSPTEAAGMGATGAFLIALFRGSLTFRETFEVLKETAYTAASLFAVLIGAWVFSNFVNLAGLPGVSIPAGLDAQGLPLGLQLIGKPWEEADMLNTAFVLEQSVGFAFKAEKWW